MSGTEVPGTARGIVLQPELDGVDTDTAPMWVIALLPLAGAVLDLIPGLEVRDPTLGGGRDLLAFAPSLALLVVGVLLAVADRRVLRRRGLIRPMHPAWELLDPVYVLGRTVVVHRRVRGSEGPLLVWIVTTLVGIAISSIPR